MGTHMQLVVMEAPLVFGEWWCEAHFALSGLNKSDNQASADHNLLIFTEFICFFFSTSIHQPACKYFFNQYAYIVYDKGEMVPMNIFTGIYFMYIRIFILSIFFILQDPPDF